MLGYGQISDRTVFPIDQCLVCLTQPHSRSLWDAVSRLGGKIDEVEGLFVVYQRRVHLRRRTVLAFDLSLKSRCGEDAVWRGWAQGDDTSESVDPRS